MSSKAPVIIMWVIGIMTITLIVYSLTGGQDSLRKRKQEVSTLLENSSFAIGTITGNSATRIGVGNQLMSFSFSIWVHGDIIYVSQGLTETEVLTPVIAKHHFKANKFFKEGEKYLVLVDDKSPDKSVMCLDKPILESQDFGEYVKEFQKMRRSK
jgi:hypothetical protein